MTFWDWFKQNGDRAFTFITLASIAMQKIDNLPPWASQMILVCGILATAAHQTFFVNPMPAITPK